MGNSGGGVWWGLLAAAGLALGCADGTTRVVERELGDAGVYQGVDAVPGYGAPGGGCTWSPEFLREAGFDQDTPLGFSGSDVVALFNARARGTIEWADGRSGTISFRATQSLENVEYDDPTKDQGYCVPDMRVPLDEVRVASSDGVLDVRVVSYEGAPLELVAQLAADGGIGMIMPYEFRFQPEEVHSPLIAKAIAVYPNHDRRFVDLELTLSMSGKKVSCTTGEHISNDPNERCNRFDGVVRYRSTWTEGLKDHHNIPPGTFYDEALGAWRWTL